MKIRCSSFLDTNVVLSLFSENQAKAERAESLLAGGGTISVQVLNEIVNVARSKMGMDWDETEDFLATLRGLVAIEPVTLKTHETALALARRYGLSIYDALIAAAAQLSDCDTLWSEDMQHGLVIDRRLRILNPFGG
jgi:predicted nucleic acid-binding protein